jgi:MFS family permease
VILYLTYWFPKAYIGQVIGLFYFGAPLAFIAGGPLTGILLDIHVVAGLKGWQWMFLIEGLLATVVGVWSFFYLEDRPNEATWLPPAEKEALTLIVALEDENKPSHGLLDALRDKRVLHLVLIYFLIQMSVYGVVFCLPTQIAALMHTQVGFRVGLVTGIPWMCALASTYLLPRLADRTGNHRLIAITTLSISAIGIGASVADNAAISLVALCFAAAAFNGVQPLFWTFPIAYLGDAAAAGGIALTG